MKKIHNYIKYTVKGLNRDKLINKIYNKIALYDVKQIDYNLTEYKIKFTDEKSFEKQLKNNNLEIISKKNKGIYFVFKNCILNIGFIIGLIISIAFLIFTNGMYLKCEVQGNSTISSYSIKRAIEEKGIKRYQHLSTINTKQLEKQLAEEFNEVSLISIIKKGNSLIINIKEKVINDEYENVDNFLPIVSDFDGRVTSISLTQGTLNVKVGDIVQKGDILVHPYIIDSSYVKRGIKPLAKIKLTTWIKETVYHQENTIVMQRTGKVKTVKNLYVGDIPISKKSYCEFSKYETETSLKKLTNILPILIETIDYYEVEEVDKVLLLDQVFDDLKQNSKENALLNLTEYDIITSERYTVTGGAGNYEISCILEVSKEIGENES